MLTLLSAMIAGGTHSVTAATAATTAGPVILAFRLSEPRGLPLPAAGEPVVVTIRVRGAVTCTFLRQYSTFSSLYPFKTVSCASGYARVTLPPIANIYKAKVKLTYAVRVNGAGGSAHRSITVQQAAGLASAPAPAPINPPAVLAIVSVSVSPKTVPLNGGTVIVIVHAAHAVTCSFSGGASTPLSVPCSSGSGGEKITFPANNGPTIVYTYSVVAQDAAGHVTSPDAFTVTQLGQPLPASLVGYLNACTPGPHCDYGPFYSTYQDYGNVAPADLGDCTFAAAADWEQIVLGLHPDPSVIGYEFSQAGGTASSGLSADALFGYWRQAGIAGVLLTGLHSYYTDQTDAENAVLDYGALLVAFQFGGGSGFGQYTMSAGGHMAVVDGFTPEGPLVVSWGETLQLTWAQWNAEVVSMWGIGTG